MHFCHDRGNLIRIIEASLLATQTRPSSKSITWPSRCIARESIIKSWTAVIGSQVSDVNDADRYGDSRGNCEGNGAGNGAHTMESELCPRTTLFSEMYGNHMTNIIETSSEDIRSPYLTRSQR